MLSAKQRLIIALDFAAIKEARNLIDATQDSCRTYKVGLELFLKYGPRGVREIQQAGVDVFLDLKLHDIPNTVYSALLNVLPLRPRFITVHASGGIDMLMAAKTALSKSQGQEPYTQLLAVTVLTHLSQTQLGRMGIVGQTPEIANRWLKSIRHDPQFGAVCSPHEARYIRACSGPGFSLVCPGIRPSKTPQNDQTRIATPSEALHSGADFLVVGRPITRATNPTLAARSVINEMESVVKTSSESHKIGVQ